MNHIRREIRDAVVTLLTGLTTTGNNVFKSRRYPLQQRELPGLCVYTLSEDSELETLHSAHMRRSLSLVIEAVAQDNDTLDDVLDLMAEEVETALAAAIFNKTSDLRALVRGAWLVSTAIAIQPAKDSEIKTGSAVMTWRIDYRTLATDPTTIN